MDENLGAGRTLRRWSLAVFACALIGPAVWAFLITAPLYEHGDRLTAIGMNFRAIAVSSAGSVLAAAIGVAGFLAEPAPRPKSRLLKIAFMLAVAVVGGRLVL